MSDDETLRELQRALGRLQTALTPMTRLSAGLRDLRTLPPDQRAERLRQLQGELQALQQQPDPAGGPGARPALAVVPVEAPGGPGESPRRAAPVQLQRVREAAALAERLGLPDLHDPVDLGEAVLQLGRLALERGVEPEAVALGLRVGLQRFNHDRAIGGPGGNDGGR